MIKVHYLNDSRAHRLLWLLEELELDYQVISYQRDANLGAPAKLKTIHPLGKSPVIEMNGMVLAESGAIFEQLCDSHPAQNLLPAPGSADRHAHIYWLHYAEGSAMPLLVDKLIFSVLPARVPFFIRPVAALISNAMMKMRIDPELKNHVALWEQTLAATGWFAGTSFSTADIIMSFPVEIGLERTGASQSAAITRWLASIRARPAYQRALQRGGNYSYAGT